jgi:hypothetical protein
MHHVALLIAWILRLGGEVKCVRVARRFVCSRRLFRMKMYKCLSGML